jgi:hypothetical protein
VTINKKKKRGISDRDRANTLFLSHTGHDPTDKEMKELTHGQCEMKEIKKVGT